MSKLSKFIKNNKGFTLIEIILVIAIIGIVTSMIFSMLINIFSTVSKGTKRINAKQITEMNLIEVSRYVRNANPEDIDTNLNKINSGDIEVKYNDEDNQIEITDGDNTKIIHNIADFNISTPSSDADIYTIKLKKYIENDCENSDCDTVIMQTKVSPRKF